MHITRFFGIATLVLASTLSANAQGTGPHDAAPSPQQNPVEAARSSAGKLATRDQSGHLKAQDGLVLTQGSLMLVKEGKLTRVTHELKLSEGIVAKPSGDITLKDGRQIKLQEGQMVTLEGNVMQAPPSVGTTSPTKIPIPPQNGNKTDYGNDGLRGPDMKPKQ